VGGEGKTKATGREKKGTRVLSVGGVGGLQRQDLVVRIGKEEEWAKEGTIAKETVGRNKKGGGD